MAKFTYTALDEYYQLCRRMGLNPDYIPNSTMNDALNILPGDPGVPLTSGTATYLAIGDGGHSGEDSGSAMGITFKDRSGRYLGLYNMIPWVLRDVDDDLTDTEMANYRMRRLENHDGVSKYAYYLKKITLIDTMPRMVVESLVNGVTETNDWTPAIGDAIHGELPTGSAASSQRLLTDLEIDITLTAEEADDVQNVTQVLYGSTNTSIISEYGLFTGIDVPNTGTSNGVAMTYTEVVNAYLTMSLTPSRILDFQAGALQDKLLLGKAFSYE